MRGFLLLTLVCLLWLGGLASAMPRASNYNEYHDEWAPERYANLDEASDDVGFQIPTLHNVPGWRIEAVFVAWHGDLGMVDVTYVSHKGVLLTLSVNRRRTSPPFIKAKDDAEETKTEERVRFAGGYARLVTYSTSSVDIMTTSWEHNRRPMSATAFVYPSKDGVATLTKQQLLDALETVH